MRPLARGFNNYNNRRRNVNANNRPDNAFGMTPGLHLRGMQDVPMKTYTNLYQALCSYQNLYLSYRNARRRKTMRPYVFDFDLDYHSNLLKMQRELEALTYSPKPLTTFIVRDPKTRRISASDFRDRVVHHALCNVIGPIFERRFIHDSFANQMRKGTHAAVKRAEKFMRKVGAPSQIRNRCDLQNKHFFGYALKADIRHYFDTVDHGVLMEIIGRRMGDQKVLWLIGKILGNHKTETPGKGMPIGNLTSQFFANIYLDRLDQYVKHTLKAKYYLRYVDDFVIFHRDKGVLERWQLEIDNFLENDLKIRLHPEKTRIIKLNRGITLLGYRLFSGYRLLKKSNARRIWKRMGIFKERYDEGEIKRSEVEQSLNGWLAYAQFANTYKLRTKVIMCANQLFPKRRKCRWSVQTPKNPLGQNG